MKIQINELEYTFAEDMEFPIIVEANETLDYFEVSSDEFIKHGAKFTPHEEEYGNSHGWYVDFEWCENV